MSFTAMRSWWRRKQWAPVDYYLAFGGFMAGISVPLYILFPQGTVQFFSTTVEAPHLRVPHTATDPGALAAHFWVQTAGGGDALDSFIMLSAALSDDNKFKMFALKANVVYCLFHFGSFLRSHYTLTPHPSFMAANYLPSMLVVLGAAAWWCWWRPLPTGASDKKELE
eukprot:TRINITY_DN11381_c0_g1_i1.p1 TRINITY_DN11381_c0_g1~~TRINITY_DN11381_c0_g1_i1.p1  ORF type:complete len:168 (-),score=13.49 TRINITY_DN11381_c0_g1_i1:214-717(-)